MASHQKLCFLQPLIFYSVFFSEQLALRLHEEERRHVQSAAPVAAVPHEPTRPYAHAQPVPAERSKKGSVSMDTI